MLLQDAPIHPRALCLWRMLCGMLCAPSKGHIHMLFARPPWSVFPGTVSPWGWLCTAHLWGGGWDLPLLCCIPGHLLLPGVGVLQMWGFSSGTASTAVPYGTEPEQGERNFQISTEVRTGMNSRGFTSHEGWEASVELP